MIKDKRIIEIADYYGLEPQLEQTVEELAELILAIQKYKRYKDTMYERDLKYLDLLGEIADCEIMILQIDYLVSKIDANIKQFKIEGIVEEKLKRQIKRIEEYKNANK